MPPKSAIANQLDSPVAIGAKSLGFGATSATLAMETHIAAHASAGIFEGTFLWWSMVIVIEPPDTFMVIFAGSQHCVAADEG